MDLLEFLRLRPGLIANNTGYSVLTSRRLDIGTLELTCKNTNTVLPYVDLVIEQLEAIVTSSSANHQTTLESDALLAQPEHLDPAAYVTLADGDNVFPWLLPFDFFDREQHSYFDHLGVPKHEAMSALESASGPASEDITAAALGLSPIVHDIITGDHVPTGTESAFWNLPSGAGWADAFSDDVPLLLESAVLDYGGLVEAIEIAFVAGTATITLDLDSAEPCDLSQAGITGLGAPQASRLHRFLRLARATKRPFRQLDAAISTFGGTLDRDLTAALADIRVLEATGTASFAELLSWWGTLNTRVYDDGEDSLYQQLFLNPAVQNPVDSAFTLNGAGTELAATPALADAHEPTILSALQVSKEDYLRLRGELPADTLNLANLSQMFRQASLSRYLGVSISDLLALLAITGIDPFSGTAQTLTFLDARDALASVALSVEQADYLFRHEFDPNGAVAPEEDRWGLALVEMVQVAQQRSVELGLDPLVVPTTLLGEDPTGEKVRGALAAVLDSTTVESVMPLLDEPALTAQNIADLDTWLGPFWDTATPGDDLDQTTAGQARYEYTWLRVLLHRRELGRQDLLDQTLSDLFGVDRTIAHALANDILVSPNTPAEDLIHPDFLAKPAEPENPPTAATDGTQFAALTRIYKAVRVIDGLGVPAEDVSFYFEGASQWLDLDQLPLSAIADGSTNYVAWNAVRRGLELRSRMKGSGNPLADIAAASGGTALSDALDILADRTGWDRTDVGNLATAFGLSHPTDFADAEAMIRIGDAIAVTRRIGLDASTLLDCVQNAADSDRTRRLRTAVKAKYGEARWPAVAQPLRDRLRIGQRDALAAHVIQNDATLSNKADLYARLLLDPEMQPCSLTSRLKAALSSVQLFIQRAFMNLEPTEFVLDDGDLREWKWMKNYRVWEANRKVFVYPENWIDPALRLRKTHLFRSLETRLLQGEVDKDAVEVAYLEYLHGLHDISNLDVVGVFHLDDPEGGIATSHVIARAAGEGTEYYHRQWIRGGTWTPWEPLELDIGSEIIAPGVYKDRLFLFWAVTDRSGKRGGKKTDQPKEGLRARIAWSEFRNGAWTPVRMSALSEDLVVGAPARAPTDRSLVLGVYEGFEATWGNGLYLELLAEKQTSYGALPKEVSDFDLGKAALFKLDDGSGDVIPIGWTGVKVTEFLDRGVPVNGTLASQRYRLTRNEATTWQQLKMATQQGGEGKIVLFGDSPNNAFVSVPHHFLDFYAQRPFFYKDPENGFMIARKSAPLVEPLPTPDDPDVDAPDGFFNPHPPIPPHPFTLIDDVEVSAGGVVDQVEEAPLWGAVTPGLASLNVENGGLQEVPDTIEIGDGATQGQAAFDVALQNLEGSTEPHSTQSAMPASGFDFGVYSGGFVATAFSHPFTREMISAVRVHGLDGLLAPQDDGSGLKRQLKSETTFLTQYAAVGIEEPYPVRNFAFEVGDALADYNWELFFHGPMLIADRLKRDQKFDDAMRWYHYVFNPLDSSAGSTPQRFWNVKPFYERTADAMQDKLMTLLGQQGTAEEQEEVRNKLIKQVDEWRDHPFEPHLIAKLRPGVYERYVVMKYIENLIAWGDHLFRQDTIESINEATQLYILASEVLGDRPAALPERDVTVQSFVNIQGTLDAFGNALVSLESYPLTPSPTTFSGPGFGYQTDALPPAPLPRGPLFCVPPNPKLLGYWDTVEDRLFKIRNCQNIEGVFRQLPLFQPPIDPALLVSAIAAGVDLGSAIAGLNAPLPRYRFSVMAQRALELAGDVRALGSGVLQALERKDAEQLSLLTNEQQSRVLDAVLEVRKQQIEEAEAALEAAAEARVLAEGRREYYRNLERVNAHELEHVKQLEAAYSQQRKAQTKERLAGILGLLPNATVGFSGGLPTVVGEFGGPFLAGVLRAKAASHNIEASKHQHEATKASIVAGWKRRTEEWDFQEAQAGRELVQIDKQIAAAKVRIAVAKRELEAHKRQIANNVELDEFMRRKFTKKELYDWTITQLSALHFQAYQLAFDVAKQAEQTYRRELVQHDRTFVQFGHWDSLRKGLLAGERLQFDIQRMRTAYLENDRREYELTKNVSLAELDPVALVKLRETGQCFLNIPEVVFDVDHPGQYLRRIKSVSLSVPAVTGPNTTLGMKLTLLSSSIRESSSVGAAYPRTGPTDDRFRDLIDGTQAIATSSGRNDAGLFQLDFSDPRYLPFEGAGVISNWRLQLSSALAQFDHATISDVVVQIRYTAREGGDGLRTAVEGGLLDELAAVVSGSTDAGSMRMFSVARDFPSEWHEFLNAPDVSSGDHTLTLGLDAERFPYWTGQNTVEIDSVELIMVLEEGVDYGTTTDIQFSMTPTPASPATPTFVVAGSTDPYGQPNAELVYTVASPPPPSATASPGTWTLVITGAHLDTITSSELVDDTTTQLDPTTIRDLVAIVHYRAT